MALVKLWSHSVVSNSLWPHGLEPIRLLHPWNFLGKSTGVGCHFLLQGIFPTQGLNLGLPHCRQTLLLSEPPGNWYRWRCHWAICNRSSWLRFLLMITITANCIVFCCLFQEVLSLTLSGVWLSHWYNNGIQFHMKSLIIMVWLYMRRSNKREYFPGPRS